MEVLDLDLDLDLDFFSFDGDGVLLTDGAGCKDLVFVILKGDRGTGAVAFLVVVDLLKISCRAMTRPAVLGRGSRRVGDNLGEGPVNGNVADSSLLSMLSPSMSEYSLPSAAERTRIRCIRALFFCSTALFSSSNIECR